MKNLNKTSKLPMMIISSIIVMSIVTMQTEEGNILNTSYAATEATFKIGSKVQSKSGGNVNIRKTCDSTINTNIVGKLTANVTGVVIDKTKHWYKIDTGKVVGYVRADTVRDVSNTAVATANNVSLKFLTTGRVNLRNRPSTKNSQVYTKIPKGKTLYAYKHKKVNGNNWYKVSYGSYDGWVSGKYLKSDKSFTTSDGSVLGKECYITLKVTSKSGLNLRAFPNLELGDIIGSIPYGRTVTANRKRIDIDNRTWYYLPGYNGWINSKYTKTLGLYKTTARSATAEENSKVALVKAYNIEQRSLNNDNTLNLISSKEDSAVSRSYDVYKITPGINIGVDIERVVVNIPESETELIDSLEAGDVVELDLSQERNNFRINNSNVVSSDNIDKLIKALDFYIITDDSAEVYESVIEKGDGSTEFKKMNYKLTKCEPVIVLKYEPGKDYVKVILENGDIGYLQTKAIS